MALPDIKVTAGAVAAAFLGVFALILYSNARKGDVTAIVILAVITAIILMLLGVAITIGAVLVAERIRSHQFQQNAMENQKLLLQQQRAQNELTRGALMLARDQQKLLPGSYIMEDPLALVGVEDAVFEDIYDE